MSQSTEPAAAAAASSMITLATLTKGQKRKLQALSRNDEISATIGIVNMLLTAIIAVRFPAHYWKWHLLRTVFYLPLRYLRFRRRGWEYYLLDWCYVVTYLSTICALLAFVRVTFSIETPLVKYNTLLIRAGFAMAVGPLAWSVFIFRNSIVFHDVDYSTSVFIHLSPAVLFWCLRWASGQPSSIPVVTKGMFRVCGADATIEEWLAVDDCLKSIPGMLWCNACSASFSAFVLPPLLLYLCVWSIPYFIIVLVWLRSWCEEHGKETLYTYFSQSQPGLVLRFERKLAPICGKRHAGPMGYMLLHLVSVVVFGSASFVMWHSFLLHTLFLTFILIVAVQNGSTYMFRVFAYRYAQTCLDEHRDKLE